MGRVDPLRGRGMGLHFHGSHANKKQSCYIGRVDPPQRQGHGAAFS